MLDFLFWRVHSPTPDWTLIYISMTRWVGCVGVKQLKLLCLSSVCNTLLVISAEAGIHHVRAFPSVITMDPDLHQGDTVGDVVLELNS